MNNNLNKMFGERYVKLCTWVPWVAIVFLMISINQNQMIKWGFTYTAFMLLLGNALYIVYRFIRFKMNSKKCG